MPKEGESAKLCLISEVWRCGKGCQTMISKDIERWHVRATSGTFEPLMKRKQF